MLRMVPLLLRNAYGSPVPGRNYLAFNSGDICVIPEIIAALIFVRQVIWHAFRLWF